MKNKDTYKNKTQNMFTAYVVRSVKGARMKYMDKNNYRESMENHLEDDAEYEPMIHFDDCYEKSFDKISRESGKPRNKLENRYYYALKKIRQWIGGEE